jgi:hypothetical protein
MMPHSITAFDSNAETYALAETLAARFGARRVRRGRWVARCPAHADRSPSLSLAVGRAGALLVYCFAGCTVPDILKAAGLAAGDLFPGRPARGQAVTQTAEDPAQTARRALAAEATEAGVWLRRHRQRLADSLPGLSRELALLPDGATGEASLTAYVHRVIEQIHLIDQVFEEF